MRSPRDAFSACLFALLEAWHIEGYEQRPPGLYALAGTPDDPACYPLPFCDPQLLADIKDVPTACEVARLAADTWAMLPDGYPSPRWPGPLFAVVGVQVSWGLPGTGALIKELDARASRPRASRVPIHERPDRVRAHFLIARTVTGGMGSGFQPQDGDPDVFIVPSDAQVSVRTSAAFQALVRLTTTTEMAYRRWGSDVEATA